MHIWAYSYKVIVWFLTIRVIEVWLLKDFMTIRSEVKVVKTYILSMPLTSLIFTELSTQIAQKPVTHKWTTSYMACFSR